MFLPELVVLQTDPAHSIRKFLPEFLEACPPAALPPASLALVLQCLQSLLQDNFQAVVKAAVLASSTLFRTALAVVAAQVSLQRSLPHLCQQLYDQIVADLSKPWSAFGFQCRERQSAIRSNLCCRVRLSRVLKL